MFNEFSLSQAKLEIQKLEADLQETKVMKTSEKADKSCAAVESTQSTNLQSDVIEVSHMWPKGVSGWLKMLYIQSSYLYFLLKYIRLVQISVFEIFLQKPTFRGATVLEIHSTASMPL